MSLRICNPSRCREQYEADLYLDGREVGRVEKALTTGYHASDYKARICGTTFAMGSTLVELREEMRDPEILAEARRLAKDQRIAEADQARWEQLTESRP